MRSNQYDFILNVIIFINVVTIITFLFLNKTIKIHKGILCTGINKIVLEFQNKCFIFQIQIDV